MTRSNPKRSGGPRSSAGKLAAAANAFKSGAYALTVVLPGEDEEAFRQLEAQFLRDFSPQDIADSAMVHDLAVLTWKKMRLARLEQSAMLRELNDPFKAYEFPPSGRVNADMANAIRRLSAGGLLDWQAAFAWADQMQGATLTAEDVDRLQVEAPLLFSALEEIFCESLKEPPEPALWAKKRITSEKGDPIPLLQYGITIFYNEYNDIKSGLDNLDEVQARIKEVQERRLLQFMERQIGRRVHDDLDRAFYRTLAELRRHQSWRRALSEITVTCEEAPAP